MEQYFWATIFSALMLFLFFVLSSNKPKRVLPSATASQKELIVIRRDGRYCPKHLCRYEFNYAKKICPECDEEKKEEERKSLERIDELVSLIRGRKKNV